MGDHYDASNRPINGWTVGTLKEYIETRLRDREEALRELTNSNKVAIELVAAANQRAINLAAEDLARRLESMNQFRDQINDERRDYLRRDFFETIIGGFDRRFEELASRLTVVESTRIGAREHQIAGRESFGIWIAIGSLIVSVAIVIVTLLVLFH